jgi:hypothetical protein
MAYADFAVRAQRDGATIQLPDDFVVFMDNTSAMPPDRNVGHGPVAYGQVEHDQPLYRSIYDDPDCVNRTKIDFDNWKQSPEIWTRRTFV